MKHNAELYFVLMWLSWIGNRFIYFIGMSVCIKKDISNVWQIRIVRTREREGSGVTTMDQQLGNCSKVFVARGEKF